MGRSLQRRIGALAVCLLAFVACDDAAPRGTIAARLAEIPHPDLVLIVVDTLRADRTTPYGEARPTTPELEAWAQRGVVFEKVLAQSSWTKISMASLMTSLWPTSHAIQLPDDGLSERALTLAEQLQDSGYATYGVQTNGWLHQSFGFHQGFDRYLFPKGADGQQRADHSSLWPHADRVVTEAERLLTERDPERPIFLYLHFMDVHEYAAPPEFKSFGTGAEADYVASIRWVDDAVRRVRVAVERGARGQETVMVLGSDHGETFGEHGVHGHARNVFSAVLEVPLVWRLPFATEPVRVATRVRNLDVAPTLLEMAGVPVPEAFAGESLLPLMTDATDEARRDRPSAAALGFPLFPDAAIQESFHRGAWVYARNAPAVPPESPDAYRNEADAPGAEYLFDRRVDPGENLNLAEREPEQRDALRAGFADHQRTHQAQDVRAEDVRIDPAIAERLRAMGYLR
ncbi:MAG: sulfatase-like hydrolase/transferase [Myxococcota bacterium]